MENKSAPVSGWILIGKLWHTACKVFPCKTEDYPTPAKRPAYSVLCKDKIQKATGFKIPEWKESLKVFINSGNFDLSRIE
ncbi:MAG: sugar nucleotide-binding protein [Alphaproteobacteria bacterium]|nr:sugar nucleotide-binding protein [Alphaproteobacteria bacterium]